MHCKKHKVKYIQFIFAPTSRASIMCPFESNIVANIIKRSSACIFIMWRVDLRQHSDNWVKSQTFSLSQQLRSASKRFDRWWNYHLGHTSRMSAGVGLKVGWKWKWPNGVAKSEMIIFCFLGEIHCFDPFRPNEDPQVLYIVGKLWVSCF